MEQLFGHDKRIQAVLELSGDFSGSHRTATDAGCFPGNNQSLLRNVVERAKETGTWIPDISSIVGKVIGKWAKLFLTMVEKTGGNVGRNSCVEFQNNNELKGLEWFSSLLESCLNKEPLSIVYKPYNAEERAYNVSPYWLKQYNNRWFLICKDERYEDNTHLALDRIVSVKANPSIRFRRTRESQDSYFRHVIGVTKHTNAQKKEVVLRVQPNRIKYIETKPFTDMQTITKNDDGTYDVSFHIEINVEEPEKNKELIQTILSFGSDVEVISPVEIRNEVRRQIQALMGRYLES